MAHGDAHALDDGGRTLVAVFAGPVARHLLHFAHDVGFHTVLVEPDAARRSSAEAAAHHAADHVVDGYGDLADAADVVVADHHRPELGDGAARRARPARPLDRRDRQPAPYRRRTSTRCANSV